MVQNTDKLNMIRECKELLDQGMLNQEEFEMKKKQILSTVEKEEPVSEENRTIKEHPIIKENPTQNSFIESKNAASGNSNAVLSAKVCNVISYFGILWLVAYFLGDKSKCKYHLNQGLLLFLFSNIIIVVIIIISNVLLEAIVTIAPWWFSLFLSFGSLLGNIAIVIITFAMFVIGIVHAVKDEEKPIPIIGGITLLK